VITDFPLDFLITKEIQLNFDNYVAGLSGAPAAAIVTNKAKVKSTLANHTKNPDPLLVTLMETTLGSLMDTATTSEQYTKTNLRYAQKFTVTYWI
jgi:hypothetical protein